MAEGTVTQRNGGGKLARQHAIRDLLLRGGGSSQEDIRAYLGGRGIAASQATLSRDLHEMHAVKIPVPGGGSVYRLQPPGPGDQAGIDHYGATFELVGNMLIVRTASGGAPGLCVLIDRLALPGIAGTIAGDDTIFAVLRPDADGAAIIEQLGGA